jgi:hypothetical protein
MSVTEKFSKFLKKSNEFDYLFCFESEIDETAEEELPNWKMLSNKNNFSCLTFWKNHKTVFPRLSPVALRILISPSSSASTKRLFQNSCAF